MRKVLVFVFLVSYLISYSQAPTLDITGSSAGGYGSVKFYNASIIGQKSADPIDYSEVRGKCFWSNDWAPGLLTLKSGKVVKMPRIKMNLYTNGVHYVDKEGVELVAQTGLVTKVSLYSLTDTLQAIAVFQSLANKFSGYKESFFQILNEGPIQLLKKTSVNLSKQKYDPSIGKDECHFVSSIDYFLRDNVTLTPLKKINKTSVFSIIKTNEEIEKWMTLKENKVKTEEDVIELLSFINSEKK